MRLNNQRSVGKGVATFKEIMRGIMKGIMNICFKRNYGALKSKSSCFSQKY